MQQQRKRRLSNLTIILISPFLFCMICAGAFLYTLAEISETLISRKEARVSVETSGQRVSGETREPKIGGKKMPMCRNDAGFIQMKKKKPSKRMTKLMKEGYEASAEDDLALAKEYEGIEPEVVE